MSLNRDFARSPVFGRDGRTNPGLARTGSPWGMGLGFIALIVLGVATFLSLNSARGAKPAPQHPVMVAQNIPPAPPVAQVAVPAPAPEPVITSSVQPDFHAPAMVVDLSQAPTAQAAAAPPPAPGAASGSAANDDKLSADERFSARVDAGKVDVAHASKLRDLAHIAPQGTVIPAILETAINSDLPGFARAVVSRDVYGFDGTTLLIPRGSKLIGQYRSGVALSQTRAFVVWSRLLTPAGVSIDIGSPAADPLGRGGLEGETDTHFFARFGSAILLSVLSAGLDAAFDRSANTAIIIGSSQQASQVADTALEKQIDIPVTVKVPQGTPLEVFVTRDLDFSGQTP